MQFLVHTVLHKSPNHYAQAELRKKRAAHLALRSVFKIIIAPPDRPVWVCGCLSLAISE